MTDRYAPLGFSQMHGYPHPFPRGNGWHKYLLRFHGYNGISIKQNLTAFDKFIDLFHTEYEDVLMKLSVMSLQGDSKRWYKDFPARK